MNTRFRTSIAPPRRSTASTFVLTLLALTVLTSISAAQVFQKGPVTSDLLELEAAYESAHRLGKAIDVERLPGDLPVTGEYVVIDAASETPQSLLTDLEALGLKNGAVFGYMVSGLLPITSISEMAALGSIRLARPAYAASGTGLVTSQGDTAMNSVGARDMFGVDGTGLTLGTLSDSYDCLNPGVNAAADVASNDLPAGVTVLSDIAASCVDEGRAMMQIIHDVAPGAAQGFHAALLGQADFALGIQELAGCPAGSAAGCTPDPGGFIADIINDDIFYFSEPFFQDGIIAQAVDFVVAKGIPYFALAGNHGRESYEANFRPDSVYAFQAFAGVFLGGTAHDFDPGPGVDHFQQITVATGSRFPFAFQWAEPYFSISGGSGAASDFDFYILNDPPTQVLRSSTNANVGADPIELINPFINVTGSATTTFNIMIIRASGVGTPRMKYIALVNGGLANFAQNEFDTQSSTVYGHMNSATAEIVGAAPYFGTPAYGVDPPTKEPFSSIGPTQIFFDLAGNAIGPITRNNPAITAPQRGNNTFFGADSDGDGFPNFAGTSAATPHAAAAAALVLEAAGGPGSLTPAQVFSALENTAIDMDDPVTGGFDVGFDFATGAGLINVKDAVALFFPPELAVDLDSQAVQYSDLIVDVNISAADKGNTDLSLVTSWTSDGGAVQAGLPSGLEIVPPTAAEACATPTDGVECDWTLQGQILEHDSDIEIAFSVTDGSGNTAADTTFIDVNAEDAIVAFDPSNPVAVIVSDDGDPSESFQLVVIVTEFDDPSGVLGYAGDIDNAVATIRLKPIGPGSSVSPIAEPCSTVNTAGTTAHAESAFDYDVLTVTCDFDNVPVNAYSVDVDVNVTGYYDGEGEDVLVIYDPSLGFTTGGGWFIWPGTDDRTNFGYTMKYIHTKNKGRSNKEPKVQGSLLMIRHVDDLNHYRLKSNALRGLAIGADSDGDGDFGWAAFLGKSTYREPGWTESEGNHDFIAYVEDRGQPGTGVDRFWIEVLDQNDVLIPDISMDRDAPDNAETIQGGNIVVPHKPKGPKAAKALEILARVDGLSGDEPAASKDADASSAELPIEFGIAQNYPNPFSTSTTISFQLPEAASVQLSIYDLTGKEVRSLVDHNIPAGFHDVTWRPEGLSSGLYIYRFSAGTFVETRRLVFLK